MFTFADANEPEALPNIAASGIEIDPNYFKFNNSAMWAKKDCIPACKIFFNLGMDNYAKFTKFIKNKD